MVQNGIVGGIIGVKNVFFLGVVKKKSVIHNLNVYVK